MTDDLQQKKQEFADKKELADGARELMDDKAFRQAIQELHTLYLGQLMAAGATEQKLELIAMMKALANIPAELKVIMNNFQMAARQQRHG